jgi:hypothetical protein
MCFGSDTGTGYADMTITSQDDDLTKKAAEYGVPETDGRPGNLDLTDETLMAARKSAKLRAAMGYGRASTFLAGCR